MYQVSRLRHLEFGGTCHYEEIHRAYVNIFITIYGDAA